MSSGLARMRVSVIVLLACGLLLRDAYAVMNVINKSPPDGKIVKLGRDVNLSCRTDNRWFFCIWNSPSGNKQCAIQENTPQNVCSGDPRIMLMGGLNNCEIHIRNVGPQDHGQWTCMVTDPVKFDNDKETISLEVGQRARVGFDPGFGMQNELRMTEGDTMEITCAALGGHPAALLSWSEPQNASLNTNERPKITPSALAHATDVRHTAVYKANLNDNDREITCVATQIDHDGRTVLFESSTSLKLKIDKIILPVDNALTQKIGIISGVLLAIIFLILLLVFCIFVCCKRRRKRSRPSSSQATTESSPEPPIKPIWTTDRLLHPQASSSPDLAAKQLHHFTDILEPADVSGIGKSQNNGGVGKINGTASQGTMSTRSTTSQGSWEEDRSVGGEVEEVNITAPPSVANRGKNSPSLHETHFGSDLELPRTVLHHPDPYQFHHVPQQHVPYQQMAPPPAGPQHGRFSVGARPNSSAAEHHPMMYPYYPNSSHNTTFPQSGQRPTSALSFPANPQSMLVDPAFMVPGSRHLPTPNGQLTTSAKSVFDCDLGCFVDLDTGETVHSHPSSSEDSTPSRRTSDAKDI